MASICKVGETIQIDFITERLNMRHVLYFVLLLLSFQSTGQEKDSSEWLFIYYMPYDNNLSNLADEIHSMIHEGVKTQNVNVVIQSDVQDKLGMRRSVFSRDSTYTLHVDSERSASIEVYDDYLDWVHANFHAEKVAVVFLNHGGLLDATGLDEYPEKEFMKVNDIRTSLKRFNKKRKSNVDLLYFQVCNKASLEALYEVSDVCDYTLASQLNLGAPNYYYTKTLGHISYNAGLGAIDVAEQIIQHEMIDMYQSFTCVDNSKFEAVRQAFKKFNKQLGRSSDLYFKQAPITIEYYGDRAWDIKSYLNELDITNQKAIAYRDTLRKLLLDELIVIHKKNHHKSSTIDYSGISIATLGKERLKLFSNMRIYRKFKFNRLPL